MAKNDPANPQLARESQDVEAPPRHEFLGDAHFGRGGAANVIKPTEEEVAQSKKDEALLEEKLAKEKEKEKEQHVKADAYKGWADKGKDLLFGRYRKASKG